MATCFVIQPFDKGPYDKRYSELLVPAITDAGLTPYRVDQDPGVAIPIDDIEKGIREAEVCLADITTNNPNVWYEVGFAMACGKPVVLICAEPRPEQFPFDVRHRTIIPYSRESITDFEKLKKEVTARLKAQAKKAEELQTVATLSQVNTVEGDLSPHEIGVLITIMTIVSTPEEGVFPHKVQESMKRSGYTAMASTLALAGLKRKEMIEYATEVNDFGNPYTLCQISQRGIDWMLKNEDRFRLKLDEPELEEVETPMKLTDDDIPF
jgi:hypothetical protein